MITSPYADFIDTVSRRLPAERLIRDDLRLLAFGTDASFYRLVPRVAIDARTEDEIVMILHEASKRSLPLTFRAAGTSLSGQAISDSILVMIGRGWNKHTIHDNGARISLQPGVVGGHANVYLAPYDRKIGPDPASINAAMIGGIAANNASGMCCGTAQNSYRTLHAMRIVLADGTLLDTGDQESRIAFLASHAAMIARIRTLREKTVADGQLAARIRAKFVMKNTTGYSLNALVDFDDPIDILQHLLIGSEGTLAFISEITYATVPEYRDRASALLIFPDIVAACSAAATLRSAPVDAVELMDRASLRSVEGKTGMPGYLAGLGTECCALLVETRGSDSRTLDTNIGSIETVLAGTPTVLPSAFTRDPDEGASLWNIRKGLFPSVGAMRKLGTTVIIEDVAFPLPRLAEGAHALQRLFHAHGYDDAILFGHALEGNLHFVITQDFNTPSEVDRYRRFIDDMTAMVVTDFDGSLKAEHGTGRNMAPFVEREWGAQAYALMKEIKTIFDPQGILNPGVVINADPEAHIKNLKPLPPAHPLVDTCIECGFCEVHCPSKDLSLTPRQRIVVYREMARLRSAGDPDRKLKNYEPDFAYAGDATCATDGLCATSCPVGIDTGKLIKDLRQHSAGPVATAIARGIARTMGTVTSQVRHLLAAVHAAHAYLGTEAMQTLSKTAFAVLPFRIPIWNRWMPLPAKPARPTARSDRKVVYFPSCINRTMGRMVEEKVDMSLTEATVALLEKAGFEVVLPAGVDGLCCGMAFDSKGFREQGAMKARELGDALLLASHNGALPVYVDMSPCLFRMKETLDARLKLYEPIDFILQHAAPHLQFTKSSDTVAIHTTCSSIKMGLAGKFKRLAEMCAATVIVPDHVECCGWAGDRGFTYPELNESALKNLRAEIPSHCSHGYSTSRTCEIGLSLHSDIPYSSIVYLVNACTQPIGQAKS